jgi:hypothetical protein
MSYKSVSLDFKERVEAYQFLRNNLFTRKDMENVSQLKELTGFDLQSCKIAYAKFNEDLSLAEQWLNKCEFD